jgi:integrase
MKEAGLVQQMEVDGENRLQNLYTPYSLRHFYASMLISDNKDLKTIQERLGHVDAAMTLNVYGHLIKERQAKPKFLLLRAWKPRFSAASTPLLRSHCSHVIEYIHFHLAS